MAGSRSSSAPRATRIFVPPPAQTFDAFDMVRFVDNRTRAHRAACSRRSESWAFRHRFQGMSCHRSAYSSGRGSPPFQDSQLNVSRAQWLRLVLDRLVRLINLCKTRMIWLL